MLVAVLTLAIGIGANTAIFSLLDAMLLRGLPYAEPERLVALIGTVKRTEVERRGNSYPDFLDWRAESTAFEGLAAYSSQAMTISGRGDPQRLLVETVSATYFDVLRIEPMLGRTFRAAEDDVGGRNAVAILSHALWMRQFSGDPSVVGQTVSLDGTIYDVLGVMPPRVAGLTDAAQLWIPFTMSRWPLDARGARGFYAVARLRPGVSAEQAQSQLDTISARLEREYPVENEARAVEVSPVSVEVFGDLRPAVLALMVAVGFVLLIACANVANLLIARAENRQREIAVRAAIGASRLRILRQLMTESLVLAGLGTAAGLVLAGIAIPALIAASPVNVPSFADPRMSLSVLGFTGVVALACGLVLGYAPAMHARDHRFADVLHGSTRGSSAGRSPVRSVLIVTEMALAIVLLVGAGLMIRTVQNLAAVDPGFDVDSLLSFELSIPQREADADGFPPAFATTGAELIERLGALPGVDSASLVSDMPLTGRGSAIFYAAESSSTFDAATRPRGYVHRVSPGFFATMGVPILRGRTYLPSELDTDSTSVIVSERVAERFWPGQNPIGKRIKEGSFEADRPWLDIVGVVPELKYRALPDNPTADPDLYFPHVDRGVQSVLLRTGTDPAAVIASVRAAIRELDPDIVIYDDAPMADRAMAMTSQSQFTTWLMGIFGGTALLLAAVGIYGVMSYLVTQRKREFGIRVALGAGTRAILGLVLRTGLKLVAVGLAVGIGAAALLSRLLESLLFGVSVMDASGIAAAALLTIIAFVACLVPALRATRVDPNEALRAE
jgi:putative ABC transport system permease protein